jgi:tungsten cofactor oxidoreducase radical SAM maturase
MDPELFGKIKTEISETDSIKSIVLGGIGEPTYSPLIGDAIRELGSYNLTLTTNAVNINDDLLHLIVQYVNMVMISVDGWHETFVKIRGIELDKVLHNIKRINELKHKTKSHSPSTGIQFVLTQDNVEDIFKVIDLADSLQVNTLVFSNLLPQTKENASKILYTRYENKETRLLLQKVLNYGLRKGINSVFPNCELKTERRCSFVDDKAMFISASGEAVPCYRLSHSYREYVFGREKTVIRHSFGNLKEKTLKEIWESREYNAFRSTVGNNRYPSCLDCDLVEGCDLVKDTSTDCYAGTPSCGDCLWARKFVVCP